MNEIVSYTQKKCNNENVINKFKTIWRKRRISKFLLNLKITKKYKQVKEVFKPDEFGISRWVTRDELSTTPLALTGNGQSRYGVFYGVSAFIWSCKRGKLRKITALRTIGYNMDNEKKQRNIREDIKNEILHSEASCVMCNSKTNLIVDHKNDLYNDKRVLNLKTQTVDDFQCLCNSCNLKKREISNKTKKDKKRYGATNIPQFKTFGIDFIDGGDETYDPKDKNAMKGTYYYDLVNFNKTVHKKIIMLFIQDITNSLKSTDWYNHNGFIKCASEILKFKDWYEHNEFMKDMMISID